MTKARTLADFISDGSPLADGTIDVSEVSGAAPLANPTFTGTASGTFSGDLDLAAIAATKAVTAVDVFVYDTSKDSDGGAWRKRTQATSWYNETLNTATRGSRREFPAVAVIVAETNKVTIYDGDDPDLPMWMVFNRGGSYPSAYILGRNGPNNTAVSFLNGVLAVCIDTVGYGEALSVIHFVSDSAVMHSSSASWRSGQNISGRNSPTTLTVDSSVGNIANNVVNDVAMTVLPNAPIDPATGLPVPTIAVATAGGVSVIKDDGTVVDITWSGGSSFHDIAFSDTNKIIVGVDFSSAAGGRYVKVYEIPNADLAEGSYGSQGSAIAHYANNSVIKLNANPTDDTYYHPRQYIGTKDTLHTILGAGYQYTWAGLSSVYGYENQATAMLAQRTSDYNTGWMNGDIKLATLSDTDDTDIVGTELVTNGTFDSDLSGWTLSGGGEVTWSSGSAHLTNTSTYGGSIEQYITGTTAGKTYTLTFTVSSISGDGRWYVDNFNGVYVQGVTGSTGQISYTTVATGTSMYFIFKKFGVGTTAIDNISLRLAEADRSVNGNGLQVFGTVTKTPVATGADLVAYSGFSASNYLEQPYNSDLDFGTGDFCFMTWVDFNSSSTQFLFDKQDGTGSATGRFNFGVSASGTQIFNRIGGTTVNVSHTFSPNIWTHVVATRRDGTVYYYVNGEFVGSGVNGTSIASNYSMRFGQIGQVSTSQRPNAMALLRFSATAPTASQIAKIYNDEKVLFQENAQATLYGSSDAVTALAHDDTTGLLHVGTSSGRSVFQGLRRVENTTDAVGAAISASNGLVVEE